MDGHSKTDIELGHEPFSPRWQRLGGRSGRTSPRLAGSQGRTAQPAAQFAAHNAPQRTEKFRDAFGHTPLSIEEKIPWQCRRLVVGTGAYGRLPVMKEVLSKAQRRKIELLLFPTAIEALKKDADDTNAVLHVTCCPPSVRCCTSFRQLTLPSFGVQSHPHTRSFGDDPCLTTSSSATPARSCSQRF